MKQTNGQILYLNWFFILVLFFSKSLLGDTSTNYLGIGFDTNVPVSYSQKRFSPTYPGISIAYRYETQTLRLGLKLQYKNLRVIKNSESLAVFSLSQELYTYFRIYEPFYFLLGPEIFYLFPLKKRALPIKGHPDYSFETGVGFFIGILYRLQVVELSFGISRWRGVNSHKFHGIEVNFFSINYPL